MSDKSAIEWLKGGATWNPVRGCTPVSAGCGGCYAARMAHRFSGLGRPYEGLTVLTDGGPRWTGEVRCVPELLDLPLRWRRPRLVFVNSMGDLFHESVPEEFISRVWSAMVVAERHTFLVLTKRSARMAAFVNDWIAHMRAGSGLPVANVWLGVSVENQAAADERIPHLLATPAAVRFLSCEPLIGPVDLSAFIGGPYVGLPGDVVHDSFNAGLGWVIVGGESGSRAREMEVAWVRSLVEQCRAAQVPAFVKQLGTWWARTQEGLPDPKGGEPDEWPADLRVREMPEVTR